jgi:hypothetical protein
LPVKLCWYAVTVAPPPLQGLYVIQNVPRTEATGSYHPQQATENLASRAGVYNCARSMEPLQ